MMGSFRRPRPRFMSSPVLSDLARFHASSPTLQLSNASVWNSVQTAVIKVFQGGGLQSNELYSLNESIRWLQRTELGSFITEYFQDQLLTKGLAHILEKIQHHDDENCLQALSEMWVAFFTEILPTLQAIFYPVQGQELTVRQMALLGFRDLVLMKLPLENMLQTAPYPPAIIQMLLILQGIHEPSGPRKEYYQLERLVDMVISPYLYISHQDSSSECHLEQSSSVHFGQPEITVTPFGPESLLAPLFEHEGEAYLERTGGVRRHTVANIHSDIQLLSITNRIQTSDDDDDDDDDDDHDSGSIQGIKSGRCGSPRPFSSEPVILDLRSAASSSLRRPNPAHLSCELAS
ncbi:proline-rich protein 5-like [Astyanax mexicanus]|uniref:proline-rich protein 5-like n=1 Tax=Astyanax mexicanus TaxID=7994 RepID=UPI0020CAFE74|nr:proline-rich protein 5-like [Astyanax mexicanus]XP_007244305.3 proline-rich protein 5-like [Astyanax mexicanus]XP_022528011.2 proline-rich protein 5-like [Astyanax mexicanus]